MNERAAIKKRKAGKRAAKWILAFMFLLGAGAAAWMIFPVESWLYAAHAWFAEQGGQGAVLFLLAYIVAVVLLVPGTVLSLSAALVYGFWALPLVLVGATVGASVAFLIARYVARDLVASFIKGRRRPKAVMEAVNEGGWKIVGLVRLSPLIPFNLQNYFFGLTAIPFWHYATATLIGMIPGAAVNVYLGTLGNIVLSDSEETTVRGSAFVVGLIATIAVSWLITRKARQKLAQAGVEASANESTGKNCSATEH
jgi:uncharacterized membrane protein YdjX (TVP38/TMEM64 family)